MIEFPAIWLRYVFFFLGGFLLLLALLYLQNGLRHGSRMSLTVMASGFFVAGLVAILWMSFTLLNQVDWSSTFSLTLPTFRLIRFGS